MANDSETPVGALAGEEHHRDRSSITPNAARPGEGRFGGVDAAVEPIPGAGLEPMPAEAGPSEHDVRLTRRVHVALGLVVAAVAAWLLYRSATELPFLGGNGEPGPGYLPVLLASCLIVLGLTLSTVWTFGPRARRGELPTLSLERAPMGRALLVWLVLVVCTALLESVGFLLAGEVLVLLVIVVVERMRSIPAIVTLVLLPPAMYFLFETLLDVQLPEGTLWY